MVVYEEGEGECNECREKKRVEVEVDERTCGVVAARIE